MCFAVCELHPQSHAGDGKYIQMARVAGAKNLVQSLSFRCEFETANELSALARVACNKSSLPFFNCCAG